MSYVEFNLITGQKRIHSDDCAAAAPAIEPSPCTCGAKWESSALAPPPRASTKLHK